jgi:hypothetical protein
LRTMTINEHAAESLSEIQLESLGDIKDILGSKEATNDEKIHLIESRLIIEKMETKNLEREIKKLKAIEASIIEEMGEADFRCADCDGSCENDAPEGQLTIFDFLDPAKNPDSEPSSEHRSKQAGADAIPEEVLAIIQGVTQTIRTVLSK